MPIKSLFVLLKKAQVVVQKT